MTDFRKQEFIIFDVETTGLSPRWGDRIVEIAAIRIKNLKPVENFYSFVDPQKEISWGAFQVNGITEEMLIGAPTAKEILPRFLEFIGRGALIGHNIGFDLSFLCHELSLLGLRLKKETVIIDTLKIARHLLPHLSRYPLWHVAESLGIRKTQEHRAMADVTLTFDVFCRLLKKINGEEDIVEIGVLPDAWEKYHIDERQGQERIFKW